MMAALPAMGAAQATGTNLYSVTYAGGGFAQVSGKLWVENVGDNVYEYEETARSAESVFLKRGGVSTWLDLAQSKVKRWTSNGWQVQRDISSLNATNGWTNTGVKYTGGVYVQTGARSWVRFADKSVTHFTQSTRDEWSVYLVPTSGGNGLFLDLYWNKVRNWGDGSNIADITTAAGPAGCGAWSKASSDTAMAYRGEHNEANGIDFGGKGKGGLYLTCTNAGPQLGAYVQGNIRLFRYDFPNGEVRATMRDGEVKLVASAGGGTLAEATISGTEPLPTFPLVELNRSKTFSGGGLSFKITAKGGAYLTANINPVVKATGFGTLAAVDGEIAVTATAKAAVENNYFFVSVNAGASISLLGASAKGGAATLISPSGGSAKVYGDVDVTLKVLFNGHLYAKTSVVWGASTATWLDIRQTQPVYSDTFDLL